MLLNLCTIILLFLLSCTNRRCANLPRMSVRAYGSIKRKKERNRQLLSLKTSRIQNITLKNNYAEIVAICEVSPIIFEITEEHVNLL